jgi:heat shock transcription factor, other eukaryote
MPLDLKIFNPQMADTNFTKIPKFLKRLFRETSDPNNKDIVWNETGDRLQIVNKESFIRNTLPSLSRTKEYSAFIRQLNIYGFVKAKIEKSDEIEEYYNCFFKKDQPSLISFMKRVKKSHKLENKSNIPTIENNITFLTNSNYRLSNEVASLKEKVEKQDRTINGILDILGRVFRSGAQNINFEGAHNKPRAESFFNYSTLPSIKNEVIPSNPPAIVKSNNSIITKKEKDNNSNEQYFTDMNDIYF